MQKRAGQLLVVTTVCSGSHFGVLPLIVLHHHKSISSADATRMESILRFTERRRRLVCWPPELDSFARTARCLLDLQLQPGSFAHLSRNPAKSLSPRRTELYNKTSMARTGEHAVGRISTLPAAQPDILPSSTAAVVRPPNRSIAANSPRWAAEQHRLIDRSNKTGVPESSVTTCSCSDWPWMMLATQVSRLSAPSKVLGTVTS